jgi:two-component system, cell cycle response regulator
MTNATRILVIEDNQTNRELMVYLLNAFGYATVEAGDGGSGIEIARNEHFDLIVCDIQLPKLDGYGVVKELKNHDALRKIPIIAVTALAMVGDRDRILAAGFDGYVSKPITPETFVQEVEKFLPAPQRTNVVRSVPAEPGPAKAKSIPIGQVRATILVVDDLPANIDFARSTLEPSGYRVLAAGGVQEAIGIAEDETPDLVLCDLHMRPQGGRAFLEIAGTKPSLKQIPIVIISSTSTAEEEQDDCLKRGAELFVRRPIEPEVLLGEIGKALGKIKGAEA